MQVLEVITYIATAAILVAYMLTVKRGKVQLLNLANFVGCWPLAAYNLAVEAYAAVALNMAFGLIGFVGLIQGWRAYDGANK